MTRAGRNVIRRKIMQKKSEMMISRCTSDWFLHFSVFHREWIARLTDRYLAKGEYPVYPANFLASLYEHKKDKEIAVLASLAARHDDVDSMLELKTAISDTPADWFRQRGFVLLSEGDRQYVKFCGTSSWCISKFFDALHCIADGRPLCEALAEEAIRRQVTMESLLVDVCRGSGILRPSNFNIRIALIVLSAYDGIGQAIWDWYPFDLECPVSDDVRAFLGYFWPDWERHGHIDDCIAMFGMGATGFFYSWLAWRDFEESHPDECRRYVKLYGQWYRRFYKRERCRWATIIPDFTE